MQSNNREIQIHGSNSYGLGYVFFDFLSPFLTQSLSNMTDSIPAESKINPTVDVAGMFNGEEGMLTNKSAPGVAVGVGVGVPEAGVGVGVAVGVGFKLTNSILGHTSVWGAYPLPFPEEPRRSPAST